MHPTEHPGADLPGVTRYFKATMMRRSDGIVSTRLRPRPDLREPTGALRFGAIAFICDVATGIASGLAVVERGLWVVTTDLQIEVVADVAEGPLRVDARCVRAGATTAVCEYGLCDESTGRSVGGGTSTNRPFPADFERSLLQFPLDTEVSHDDGVPVGPDPLDVQLGVRASGTDGAEVDVTERHRNPWGILHGGMTAVLVDAAARRVTARRFRGMTVRYLAGGKVGPVRATASCLASSAAGDVVCVEVRDLGANDRLMSVATVTTGDGGGPRG